MGTYKIPMASKSTSESRSRQTDLEKLYEEIVRDNGLKSIDETGRTSISRYAKSEGTLSILYLKHAPESVEQIGPEPLAEGVFKEVFAARREAKVQVSASEKGDYSIAVHIPASKMEGYLARLNHDLRNTNPNLTLQHVILMKFEDRKVTAEPEDPLLVERCETTEIKGLKNLIYNLLGNDS
jgi:hypothetical protein